MWSSWKSSIRQVKVVESRLGVQISQRVLERFLKDTTKANRKAPLLSVTQRNPQKTKTEASGGLCFLP